MILSGFRPSIWPHVTKSQIILWVFCVFRIFYMLPTTPASNLFTVSVINIGNKPRTIRGILKACLKLQ